VATAWASRVPCNRGAIALSRPFLGVSSAGCGGKCVGRRIQQFSCTDAQNWRKRSCANSKSCGIVREGCSSWLVEAGGTEVKNYRFMSCTAGMPQVEG
jgi:hypothetical protein